MGWLRAAIALIALGLGVGTPARAAPGTRAPVPVARREVREAPVPVVVMEARAERPLGEWETRYPRDGVDAPRAVNVERAAVLLDGAVIPPRGRLSFDERVGRRTLERGFVAARVLRGGDLSEGIGGGICQVASTLFAAAYTAGFPIERARPHSRVQRYAPAGLDAAISWQRSDLVIGNPLPVPVTITARAHDGELRVALHAEARQLEVDWDLHVTATLEPYERVVLDPRLPAGTRVVDIEGVRGVEVTRRRTFTAWSGERVRERQDLRYPPVTREIRVGR